MTAEERRDEFIEKLMAQNGVPKRMTWPWRVALAAYSAGEKAGRSSMQEEAEKAVEDEKVDAESTMREDDFAYNLAIQHAAAAIRAIQP